MYDRFMRLLETLPAIILVTFADVLICSAVGAITLLLPMPEMGREYPHIVLGAAILAAIATQMWLIWGHKLRMYIKSRSTLNE